MVEEENVAGLAEWVGASGADLGLGGDCAKVEGGAGAMADEEGGAGARREECDLTAADLMLELEGVEDAGGR